MAALYMSGWEPNTANGVAAGAWNRRDEPSKDHVHGPEVCWDKDGSIAPLGLVEMDDEEKDVFASVNSPLKPPAQSNKDATPREPPSRKVSISHVTTPGPFALNSPATTRPGARRQATQDAYPFPSPSLGKNARDVSRPNSPPPSLARKKTDLKDSSAEDKPAEEAADHTRTPFGTLKRISTLPMSAGPNAPASPWAASPSTSGFPPMGAFGNFAIGSGAPGGGTPDKRPGLAGGRAESRFKGLMSKDSNIEDGRSLREKPSIANLAEDAEDDIPTGSAALGGGDDSPIHDRDVGTPSHQSARDKFGFGAFGMSSEVTPFRGLGPQHDQYLGTPPGRGQQQNQQSGNEPMSPTGTNPYQSPEHPGAEPEDLGAEGHNMQHAHLPGLGGFINDGLPQMGGFGGIAALGRGPAAPPSDRSQTSSVGPQRGFPSLGSLGGLGALPGLGGSSAWGAAQGSIGTPTRDRAGLATNFTDNGFGSSADLQSPGLAGLGQSNLFNNAPGSGRGPSRLGSFLPTGMHDQMLSGLGDDSSELGEFGGHGGPGRDAGSPFRNMPGTADLTGGFPDMGRFGHLAMSGAPTPPVTSGNQDPIGARSIPPQAVSSSASNQPPATQQKTMVMPDRMRWIYRDPQGNTQGPWSGLEMHDWYKAGFFSPELLVKKYEDPEYEPLAQLIRRIGNSREPFLVPQIGIPHGVPSSNPPAAWNGPMTAPASGAQPPFANSFPSFGTTLTADQQNALERRKQEEQYLMARQKEHLAQQQIAQKFQLQGQYGMLPQQLHHHSSAQSLHSQPSFGNIASPSAFQQTPHPGPSQGSQNVPGFFDNSFRNGPIGGLGAGLGAVGAGVDMLGNIREEELPGMNDRLNPGNRAQGSFGGIGQNLAQEQQVAQMLNDRQRLQEEQMQHDASQRGQQEQHGENERFTQFQGLQPDAQADPFSVASGGVIGKPIAPPSEQRQIHAEQQAREHEENAVQQTQHQQQGQMSLTEQVQQAQSGKHSPVPASAWGKVETSLPQPFPPAPSQSPLPAPAAQRSRANMADALHAESRSQSQTPSVDTPSASIAPWAKEPAEAPRGPSLREIQEAEARVAAQQEAVAAEARRVALEREIMSQVQAVAPAPGLPSSANWASAQASPATPSTASSAWAKTAVKPSAAPNANKTLAQIQKEEEARKKRQLAAAASLMANNATGTAAGIAGPAAGKRYADLASKVASSSSPMGSPIASSGMAGSAWTTVGASGKVKTPAPTPTPVIASRTVSGASGVPAIKKPIVTRSATNNTIGNTPINANDEFKKWAANELRQDLQKGTNAEDFVANLLALGNELEIVQMAVHSVTSTIQSRHFAEEFLRRRRLAEKGLIDASSKTTGSGSPANNGGGVGGQSGGGGWSEVAKKGPVRSATEEREDVGSGNFKVVAAKGKKVGGKR